MFRSLSQFISAWKGLSALNLKMKIKENCGNQWILVEQLGSPNGAETIPNGYGFTEWKDLHYKSQNTNGPDISFRSNSLSF